MKLVSNHPQVMPVFIDDKGNAMKYKDGIKELRHSKKMNTKQFGELLGVTFRTVQNWEAGREPSLMALLFIKHLFNL